MRENKKITIKNAVLINAGSRYVYIILNVVINAVLARIIEPEDYGVIAIITVVTTFFSTLSDMGLSTAIIQNRSLNERDINSIYAFSVYVSIGLMVIFFLFARVIAIVYNDEMYLHIGRWLSISLLFSSINMVPNGILNREKRFLDMAIRNLTICLITAIVTITVAFCGAGIYALVIQSILTSVLNFLWSIILTRQKFYLKFEIGSIKKIASYSGYQYAFGILNYMARNLDNLLAGRFIGAVELAFYNRAYGLMLYPVNNITGVITPVLHPMLAEYQDNKEYLYKQNMKLIKCLASIGVFVEVYCFFAASDIIELMYGSNWTRSIECFRILSIAIATQMVTGTTGSIFQALGETKLLFKAASINVSITVLATIIGIFTGNSIEHLAVFVACSYLLHFFISFFVMIHYGFKRSYLTFLIELRQQALIFILLIIAGVVFPEIDTSCLLNLIIKGIYLGVVYLVCLFITKEYKFISLLRRKQS